MLGQSTPGQAPAGQPQRLPPGLTPLGPIQPPLGSPPATSQPQAAGPTIESEPLPPITPQPAPVLVAPAPTAPSPAPLPNIITPTSPPPVPALPTIPAPVAPTTAVQPFIAPIPAAPTPAAPTPAPQPPTTHPPTQPSAPGTALERDWIARPAIILQALDKVTARVTTLTGKTGETLRYGSLAILVRACATRPPDLPADAAGFIEVTDRGAATPVFRGWMLRSSPGLGVMEHPVYDLRITGCQG